MIHAAAIDELLSPELSKNIRALWRAILYT
jgi:hypothetical protein